MKNAINIKAILLAEAIYKTSSFSTWGDAMREAWRRVKANPFAYNLIRFVKVSDEETGKITSRLVDSAYDEISSKRDSKRFLLNDEMKELQQLANTKISVYEENITYWEK